MVVPVLTDKIQFLIHLLLLAVVLGAPTLALLVVPVVALDVNLERTFLLAHKEFLGKEMLVGKGVPQRLGLLVVAAGQAQSALAL